MAGLVPAIHVFGSQLKSRAQWLANRTKNSDRMAVAFVPGIHILTSDKTSQTKTWMAGTSPAMTLK